MDDDAGLIKMGKRAAADVLAMPRDGLLAREASRCASMTTDTIGRLLPQRLGGIVVLTLSKNFERGVRVPIVVP